MEYRKRAGELTSLNAQVVAISVDPPATSAALAERYDLPFAFLCDVDRRLITEWNAINRRERGGIPYPSTWVIGDDRTVRFRKLERKAARVDPKPVVQFLRGEITADRAGHLSKLLPPVGASIRWVGNVLSRVGKKD